MLWICWSGVFLTVQFVPKAVFVFGRAWQSDASSHLIGTQPTWRWAPAVGSEGGRTGFTSTISWEDRCAETTHESKNRRSFILFALQKMSRAVGLTLPYILVKSKMNSETEKPFSESKVVQRIRNHWKGTWDNVKQLNFQFLMYSCLGLY